MMDERPAETFEVDEVGQPTPAPPTLGPVRIVGHAVVNDPIVLDAVTKAIADEDTDGGRAFSIAIQRGGVPGPFSFRVVGMIVSIGKQESSIVKPSADQIQVLKGR